MIDANLKTKSLEELVQEVPASLHSEIRTFIEFILYKQESLQKQTLRQDWANALKKHNYTSMELQDLSIEWRAK